MHSAEEPTPKTARDRLLEIVARHHLVLTHPEAVRSELVAILERPGLSDGTIDRTDLPFVTIDNPDSRDLDQALYIEHSDSGGYTVYYALADASYYVRPETALFEEALLRGASYYLPELCLPMLPVELSEGLISLNSEVDRRALLLVMPLSPAGEPLGTRFERARIRSRAKLTYDGVQRFHDAPGKSPITSQPYASSLMLLKAVGEQRRALADERGVVDFNRQELRVGMDDGAPTRFTVGRRIRNQVEGWNEQVSLLCNIEGARLLEEAGSSDAVQPIFRVHPAPLAHRQAKLAAFTKALARTRGLSESWTWDGPAHERLADYLARLPDQGTEGRVRASIEHHALYLNQASTFQARPDPHYALGVDCYARFSSPMREVVGIFTHKEALEQLGYVPAGSPERDRALRARVIEAANRAKQRQRRITKEVNKLAIDQLLKTDLDRAPTDRPERRGTIVALKSSRLYVLLDAFPIELKVYTEELSRRHGTAFGAGPHNTTLKPEQGRRGPTFRVGDAVHLRTRSYDEQRRRWVLTVRV